MKHIEQHHSIHVDEANREVYFTLGGLWELDSIKAMLAEMDAKAASMVAQGGPFYGVGTMRDLVPQTREVADYIRRHLMAAKDVGLRRVAIIEPPALVKSQYRRLSDGVDVQFFDSKADAIAWVRS